MFTHEQIWRAIDGLASDHRLSTSGLAKRAGLDATSFNRSKRINAEGRERWPSTESIAKILAATTEPLEVFTQRILDAAVPARGLKAGDRPAGGRRGRAPRLPPELHAPA